MICGNFSYFILVHDSNKWRMPICYEQSKITLQVDMNVTEYLIYVNIFQHFIQ